MTGYIWYYSAVSVIFLTVLSAFYVRQRRVPTKRDRYFTSILICAMCGAAMDVAAAVLDTVAPSVPVLILHIVNIAYLASIQLCPYFLFLYAISPLKMPMKRRKLLKLLVFTPALVSLLLLAASPFTTWAIYYLDSDHYYQHGTAHMALYLAAGFYVIVSAVAIIYRRRHISKNVKSIVTTFCVLVVTSMIIQALLPRYLLTTTATGLAVIAMYNVLQSPGDRIDPVTELFSRNALSLLIENTMERSPRLTVAVLRLTDFAVIGKALKMHEDEEILASFSRELQRAFPKKGIVHASSSDFVVLFPNMLPDDLADIQSRLPEHIILDNNAVDANIEIHLIGSDCFPDNLLMLEMVDYIIDRRKKKVDTSRPHIADKQLGEAIAKEKRERLALESAIDNGKLEVRYTAYHTLDGSVRALEALAYAGGELSGLRSEQLFAVAKKCGRLSDLTYTMLRSVCEFVRTGVLAETRVMHIALKLPTELCMRENLAGQICTITDEMGIEDRSMIAFSISESQESNSVPMIYDNLNELAKCGFVFVIDRFGAGYTDFGKMTCLPLSLARLDRKMVAEATDNDAMRSFLTAMTAMINRLGMASVSDMADDEKSDALLRSMGVTLYSGELYSGIMTAEKTMRYLKAN